jgi:hypothetical protein
MQRKNAVAFVAIAAVAIAIIVVAYSSMSVQTKKAETDGVNSNATATPPLETEDYNPVITPSNFVSGVDNPYFALAPGSTYTYQSETDEGTEKNIVIVTNETRNILGVSTVVVWDRVWLDEELIEETYDWFAQDKEGNVWYMGEGCK